MHRLRNRPQLRIRIALYLDHHATDTTLIHRKTPTMLLPSLLSCLLLFGHLNNTPALFHRLLCILPKCIKRLLRLINIPRPRILAISHIAADQDHGGGHDGHSQLCR